MKHRLAAFLMLALAGPALATPAHPSPPPSAAAAAADPRDAQIAQLKAQLDRVIHLLKRYHDQRAALATQLLDADALQGAQADLAAEPPPNAVRGPAPAPAAPK